MYTIWTGKGGYTKSFADMSIPTRKPLARLDFQSLDFLAIMATNAVAHTSWGFNLLTNQTRRDKAMI